MEDSGKDKRKIANIVVDSAALLRLSIPFLLLLGTGISIIIVIGRRINAEMGRPDILSMDAKAIQMLGNMVVEVTKIGAIGILVTGILTFVLWIFYSHRLFGPTISIRKHIASLCEGDYEARIHLRKSDEFKAIADDLNRLSEILQNKK